MQRYILSVKWDGARGIKLRRNKRGKELGQMGREESGFL